MYNNIEGNDEYNREDILIRAMGTAEQSVDVLSNT